MSEVIECDVAIIGGGPGGSTCGSFLRKYKPDIRVSIFEREIFPRDHVGESQLPLISRILDELGAWDKIEQANFPVKVGATYRWGNSDDLWDFNFLPNGEFSDETRPAKFAGQRLETAFQVDRAVYDKILLDHAREYGCDVTEDCGVREVHRESDKVTGLTLSDGRSVKAKWYIDASGHSALLRRSMGVEIEEPSALRNIAVWDYWQNAEWAVSLGIGGTRIQVLSVGYGWLWFIPLSPTRTSIGLVCPADYYKQSGLKAQELYTKALADEPRVNALLKNAQSEGRIYTTKDWSFVSEQMTGENWMLVGEAAGFADPILSAGLSLTHSSAREAAFTILESGKGRDAWLMKEYNDRNYRKVLSHIRFADYWYSANAHFSELKEFTREIAKDAGLELDAEQAFQWIGTGGFVEEDMGVGGLGLFNLEAIHLIAAKLSKTRSTSAVDGYSGFLLNLKGAEKVEVAHYDKGHVVPIPAYRRDGKTLPLIGFFGWAVAGLQHSPSLDHAVSYIGKQLAQMGAQYDSKFHGRLVQTLEAMARDGWVKCKDLGGGAAPLNVKLPENNCFIEVNHDADLPGAAMPESLRGLA